MDCNVENRAYHAILSVTMAISCMETDIHNTHSIRMYNNYVTVYQGLETLYKSGLSSTFTPELSKLHMHELVRYILRKNQGQSSQKWH